MFFLKSKEKKDHEGPAFSFILSYILHHIKPHKLSFYIFIFNSFCVALLSVTGPFIVKKFIDNLTLPLGYYFYFWISLYFLEIVFIIVIYRIGDYAINIKMIPALRRSITQEAMEELMKKNLQFYHEEASGDLASRIKDLIKNIPDFIRTIIERLGEPILSLVMAITFLYILNPFFGYALLLWILSCVAMFCIVNPFILRYGANMANYGSKITGYNVDILTNIIPLRLFGSLKQERRLATPLQEEAQKAEIKMEWGYFFLWSFYGVSIFIFEAFTLFYMIKFWKANILTVGDCFFILTLHGRIFSFVWEIALDASSAAKLYAGISQSLHIIYKPMNNIDIPNAGVLQVSKGDILVKDLVFSYNTEGSSYRFSCPHLFIPGGQKVGIVGQSGAGKTTFVNLLMGFYSPQKGQIFIDGQDISQMTRESIWKAFGVVSQEGGLFNRSIKDNIAYGCADISMENIQKAAKMANIHDTIVGFTKGYDTPVGERGGKLSGGQRQRIHLARCIVKNASILVLDEATSALDSKTEGSIFQQIQDIMGQKTTLMIAHRLSTLKAVERILVFSNGTLREDGAHLELLGKKGLYEELWRGQQDDFQNVNNSHIFVS